jgi:hypothetical protein
MTDDEVVSIMSEGDAQRWINGKFEALTREIRQNGTQITELAAKVDALPCSERAEQLMQIKTRQENHFATQDKGFTRSTALIVIAVAILSIIASVTVGLLK